MLFLSTTCLAPEYVLNHDRVNSICYFISFCYREPSRRPVNIFLFFKYYFSSGWHGSKRGLNFGQSITEILIDPDAFCWKIYFLDVNITERTIKDAKIKRFL